MRKLSFPHYFTGSPNLTRRCYQYEKSDNDFNRTVTGTVYIPVTHVSVNWPWLTPPALLVLLTCVCLLVTMYQNKRRGYEVWKSSSIVALQALGMDARQELCGPWWVEKGF